VTRINLVSPSELHTKHLVAEAHEITRVFALARKAQHELHKKNIPLEYTLGTGHVLFFYNRLGFIVERYSSLCSEMRSRGFKVNEIAAELLLDGIDKRLIQGYSPTLKAVEINRKRIADRMPNTKGERNE